MNALQCLIKSKILSIKPRRLSRVGRLVLVLIGCSLLTQAQSQADKRLVLADQYFAAGDYFTAAGLYGQFLNPPIKEIPSSGFPLNSKKNSRGKTGSYATKQDIVMKQADSYRLAHYWTEAAALYKECFEKDPAAYAAAIYWYGVCQRSLGNYAAAEEIINQYLNEQVGGSYQQAAANEKATLQFIRSQIVRPDSVLYRVQKMEAPGAEKGVFALAKGAESQFLITSTQTDSVTFPGINPHHNRLFHSQLVNGGLQNIEPVIMEGSDVSLNQGAGSLSADGNHLYFTQWKKDNSQAHSAIYYSTKKESGWGQPQLLSSVNQQGYNSQQPFCSADGKFLFFASDRKGGMGGFDIWYAPLQADGTTGEPVNAGAVINTAGNEQAPFYHTASQTLVFASDRMPGMGGYDLFAAKGNETTWKAPENMGHPVNSSRDDVYYFASENGNLLANAYFSSDRGSECCLATYTVSKTSKKKLLTGIVRDCKDNEPLADAEVIMKAASGETFRTTTGEDGAYLFESVGEVNRHQLLVSKEKYNETTSDVMTEGSHEGWLTDTLYAAAVCLEKKLVIKVENVVSVYFDFDQSKLKDRGMEQLDSIYSVLTEDTTATIQISGYTDGLGSAEYNKKLSDKRAKACADYLIEKGIDAARISFESFGACCPVEMEMINGRDNPDGRSMNRRALININKE
jgi:OmpA-OmpF porin, OOP family